MPAWAELVAECSLRNVLPTLFPPRRRDHARLEVRNTGRLLANLFLEQLYQQEGPPDAGDAPPAAGSGGGSDGGGGGQ